MRTAASIARLCEIKDATEEDAKLIRAIWRAPNIKALREVYPDCDKVVPQWEITTHVKRKCIDKLLRTSGVEFLGDRKRGGGSIYYCNSGDTYATTVLFVEDRLVVGCIGDYVNSMRQESLPY